jgi:hypothetical protein
MKPNITLLVTVSLTTLFLLQALANRALAGQTVLECSTDDYRVKVQRNFNAYEYIAWKKGSSIPSLVLKNGRYYDDGRTGDSHYTSYTFRNKRYTYEVYATPMTGGLTVKNNGRVIYSEHCE